jgi:hypothetical protein
MLVQINVDHGVNESVALLYSRLKLEKLAFILAGLLNTSSTLHSLSKKLVKNLLLLPLKLRVLCGEVIGLSTQTRNFRAQSRVLARKRSD